MKKLISFLLVFFLTATVGLTASAEDTDDGFSVEEMPEFGDTDVIYFPEDGTVVEESPITPSTDPTIEETSNSESAIAENAPNEKTPDSLTNEGESETIASSPAPENETIPSKQNNYPVIIIAAVLAVCAILFVIVQKRKPAKRRDG